MYENEIYEEWCRLRWDAKEIELNQPSTFISENGHTSVRLRNVKSYHITDAEIPVLFVNTGEARLKFLGEDIWDFRNLYIQYIESHEKSKQLRLEASRLKRNNPHVCFEEPRDVSNPLALF